MRWGLTGLWVVCATLIASGSHPAASALTRPPVITMPSWLAPSVSDAVTVARHYGVTDADFDVECNLSADGFLGACRVSVVRRLALAGDDGAFRDRFRWSPKGRMAPQTWDGSSVSSYVSIPVTITSEGYDPVVSFGEPRCVQCLTQQGNEVADTALPTMRGGTTPSEAARHGIDRGTALIRCRSHGERRVSDCSLWHETPVGWGLGGEALRKAEAGEFDLPRGLVAFTVDFRPEAPVN